MKVVAIIPARAGSKGILNKNILEVGGKPLIAWSIEAAIASKKMDAIVVTSDGEAILAVAKRYPEVTLVHRPKELAQDNTPTAPVILHALNALGIDGHKYESFVLLQPTSPLRDCNDINGALEAFQSSDATALISVSEPEHHPLKSFKVNKNGYLEGLVNNDFPFMPRQELPKVYQPNGAIYINSIKEFLETEAFFTNKTISYLMSSEKSIDLDRIDDVNKIENQLKNNPPCKN